MQERNTVDLAVNKALHPEDKWGSGGLAPGILSFSNRKTKMVELILLSIYLRGKAAVLFAQEVEWIP
jgi:hypothetical protein